MSYIIHYILYQAKLYLGELINIEIEGNFSSPIRGELGWSSSDFALFHEQEQEHLKLRYRRHNLACKKSKSVSFEVWQNMHFVLENATGEKKMGEYLLVETIAMYIKGKKLRWNCQARGEKMLVSKS